MLASLLTLLLVACQTTKSIQDKPLKVDKIEDSFIYDMAPFPECHASSIVELDDGSLMATWFGGTREKNPDVTIWSSFYKNGTWSELTELADGIQNDDLRYPCWNPVLFKHSSGKLYLFYKVGPNPREWWGEMRISMDEGKSWSDSSRIPDGNLGPIRAKPIELQNGNILCPSSEEYTSGPWKTHMEIFNPTSNTWTKILVDHDSDFDVIQPTILRHDKNTLQILCRSTQNKIVESWSSDNGRSWGKLMATSLPNPSAGVDAISLPNGKHLLIYNPTIDGPNDRAKLSLAISSDGKVWEEFLKIEDEPTGEFSYPAMVRASDGKIHISYTWNRKKIKHLVLDVK